MSVLGVCSCRVLMGQGLTDQSKFRRSNSDIDTFYTMSHYLGFLLGYAGRRVLMGQGLTDQSKFRRSGDRFAARQRQRCDERPRGMAGL